MFIASKQEVVIIMEMLGSDSPK